MKTSELIQKYPWLERTNSVEDYLSPEYYEHLLKPYMFGGVSDIRLLENFLKDKKLSNIMELGCGSGRASGAVVRSHPNALFTFSDLSERMLEAAKKHLPSQASFVVSDAIEFMKSTKDQYDFAYTLWSFSHSTHQHVHRMGIETATQYISLAIKKFILENIRENGAFFLIHFDSLSAEQYILMRQWRRVFPAFANIEKQSPSKQIIEKVLMELDTQGVITLSIDHLLGDPITYKSKVEALEIFMNFHLETYFNNLPLVSEVIEDIGIQIEKHRNADGSYSISPGCYVYSFIKN